jgi:glycosyltransferase involved in cell wall biosynthesis
MTESKPRIAIVSPFLDKRHGTERCMVEQIHALADEFEFHVYSSRVEDLDLKKIVWHRIPWFPGPLLVGFVGFFCVNHIARWFDRVFRNISTDLVCSPGINCFDADLVAVHIVFAEFRRRARENLRFRRNPPRFWLRLLHRRLYYSLIIFLERCIYGRLNLPLVAIAGKVCADLQRFYGRTSGVSVVYYGVDSQKFSREIRQKLRAEARNAMGYSGKDFLVLLVGNDWIKKGLACLLKAAALLRNANLKIAVAGKDELSPFRDLLSSRQLGSSVQFFPVRPDPEFYYAAADVYVGPSLEDAFALPPLEAMACGVPAIVSRRAGVSELVTQGEDGYILEDPEQPEELAPLIARLQEDDNLRQRMGAKASATARQYTWQRNATQFREALLSALMAKRATDSVRRAERERQEAQD